jgi:hypothetical protein
MIVFYTDKSIIMMIQSLYNKTWTTWQLGKKCGVWSFEIVMPRYFAVVTDSRV